MTQPEHYPMNNHDNNSPTQSSMGFINNFPSSNQVYNNGTHSNNQWQQMTRSPNSMGSPTNPGMSSSSMPAAPSPLLNSINSSSIMGMSGTPQQPSSVKTPLSQNSLTLRNPFEDDLVSRPASRQQMPPPTSNNQRLYFDTVKEFRSQIYCNGNDYALRFRQPMAYNTIGTERFVRYPVPNINRSPSIPIQKAMAPQLSLQMPVTSAPPAQTTTTKRRVTKKQKEQQEQMQIQSPQLNGMGMMPNNFPHGISPMGMDLSRPCSSHDLSNCDPRARNSPGSMHLNALGRSQSTDNFRQSMNLKLMPNEKCATLNYPCAKCEEIITSDKRGLRCTAAGRGCFLSYHIDCVGLTIHAYNQLVIDPRCEWVCLQCQDSKSIHFKVN